MRFDKRQRMDLACEETRYCPSGVLVKKEGDRAFAVATNGRILAIVPVELDEADSLHGPQGDGRSVVPAEAWALAAKKPHKGVPAHKNGPTIELNGNATVRMGAASTSFPLLDKRFPDYDSMLPKGKAEYSITLNPALLLDLAKALGAMDRGLDAVRLEFFGDNAPVRVVASGTDGAHGLIMPIALS